MNLTWTLCAGASPAPASWAAMEAMLYAKGSTDSVMPGPRFERGQVGHIKAKVLELVASHDGLTAPQLCELMPSVSRNRANCAVSQLFKSGRVQRSGTFGNYVYRAKES